MNLNKIINQELKKFKEFKKTFVFNQLELTSSPQGVFYNDLLIDDLNGGIVNETEDFVNVGYKLKGAISKVLSNLFPYEFIFKGKKVKSIESVFQGLKFSDINQQNLVLNYFGTDSNNIKIATDYNWKESGVLYWQGKPFNRFSSEYENFVDELYVSAIQNPLYRNSLKNNKKYILHSIGEESNKNTVFTRFEFEKMLNSLSQFLKQE